VLKPDRKALPAGNRRPPRAATRARPLSRRRRALSDRGYGGLSNTQLAELLEKYRAASV